MDVSKLPPTKTKIGLILADVGQAMFLSRLRYSPDFEVGLLRAEFMLGNIGVHPMALEAYDNGTLNVYVEEKLKELDNELTKIIKEQLDLGILTFDLNLRKYVGIISGLTDIIEDLSGRVTAGREEELAVQRKIRECDRALDAYLENATHYLNEIKTSTDIKEHIAYVMGYYDKLLTLGDSPEDRQKKQEIEEHINSQYERIKDDPEVRHVIERIKRLREDVAQKVGLGQRMDEVRNLPKKISEHIKSKGYRTGKELYVQSLAQGLALFAWHFMVGRSFTGPQTLKPMSTETLWADFYLNK